MIKANILLIIGPDFALADIRAIKNLFDSMEKYDFSIITLDAFEEIARDYYKKGFNHQILIEIFSMNGFLCTESEFDRFKAERVNHAPESSRDLNLYFPQECMVSKNDQSYGMREVNTIKDIIQNKNLVVQRSFYNQKEYFKEIYNTFNDYKSSGSVKFRFYITSAIRNTKGKQEDNNLRLEILTFALLLNSLGIISLKGIQDKDFDIDLLQQLEYKIEVDALQDKWAEHQFKKFLEVFESFYKDLT